MITTTITIPKDGKNTFPRADEHYNMMCMTQGGEGVKHAFPRATVTHITLAGAKHGFSGAAVKHVMREMWC